MWTLYLDYFGEFVSTIRNHKIGYDINKGVYFLRFKSGSLKEVNLPNI